MGVIWRKVKDSWTNFVGFWSQSLPSSNNVTSLESGSLCCRACGSAWVRVEGRFLLWPSLDRSCVHILSCPDGVVGISFLWKGSWSIFTSFFFLFSLSPSPRAGGKFSLSSLLLFTNAFNVASLSQYMSSSGEFSSTVKDASVSGSFPRLQARPARRREGYVS